MIFDSLERYPSIVSPLTKKLFCKSFRLDRQDGDPMVLLWHRFVVFIERVSRVDHVVLYNTSGTDDRKVNRRKRGKSPFLSKRRDEQVKKICPRIEARYVKLNLVVSLLQYGIDLAVVSKSAKKSVNSRLRLSWTCNLGTIYFIEFLKAILVRTIRFYYQIISFNDAIFDFSTFSKTLSSTFEWQVLDVNFDRTRLLYRHDTLFY